MKWVFLLLFAISLIVWFIASFGFSRAGTRPGEGGTRPLWTDAFAIFATATMACIPAGLVGYVFYLIVNGAAATDAWGYHWGTICFWVAAIISGGGGFFPLIWNKAWYTAEVSTGSNGSIRPFGRRWRGHWLAEGDHMMPWFVDVTNVDMLPIPGQPITFTQQTKDKAPLSCTGNWTYQVFEPDAKLDAAVNQELVFNARYKSAAKEYIVGLDEDELLKPDGKNGMAAYVTKELCTVASSYAKVTVNIEELLPPQAEMDAAGKARADSIGVVAYLTRWGKFKDTNPGLEPAAMWEAFERFEGKRDTDQIIIQGLQGSGNPIDAAAAEFLAQRARDNNQKTGGK